MGRKLMNVHVKTLRNTFSTSVQSSTTPSKEISLSKDIDNLGSSIVYGVNFHSNGLKVKHVH